VCANALGSYDVAQLIAATCAVSVVGASAVLLSFAKAPQACAKCASSGGERCVFCDASGRRASAASEDVDDGGDVTGRALGLTRRNPYECTACKGSGMILCRACRGSGYVR